MSKSRKEFRLEDGTPVTSTETVYKAYASKRNKERYLKRRQAEYEKISLDDNGAYDIAAADNTEETVEKEHEIAMLRHAIKTLTVREQGLIMDYFFNDYSLRTLAIKYGVSHTKIHSEIDFALSKLKDYIVNNG